MKNCTRCGSIKDLGAFSTDRQKKDGLRNWCKACVRDHRQINADAIKASKLRYRTENPEKVRQSEKAYREANRDSILEKQREYDAKNQQRIAERVTEYYARNPEKKWVNNYQSRARKRGYAAVVKEFTKQDIVDTYGDACHYCGVSAFEEIDHHIPVAAGGEHSLENVRPCCSQCNNEKSRSDRLAAEAFRNARNKLSAEDAA